MKGEGGVNLFYEAWTIIYLVLAHRMFVNLAAFFACQLTVVEAMNPAAEAAQQKKGQWI